MIEDPFGSSLMLRLIPIEPYNQRAAEPVKTEPSATLDYHLTSPLDSLDRLRSRAAAAWTFLAGVSAYVLKAPWLQGIAAPRFPFELVIVK